MADEIAVENGRARDLDLGSSHTAYHHASLINLYLHVKFHWNQRLRNFLWTDGRTYVRMDGDLRPTLLGLLRRVDLIIPLYYKQTKNDKLVTT